MYSDMSYVRPALSLLDTDPTSAQLAPILENQLLFGISERIPIILGKDQNGKTHIEDLRSIHHLLVVGIQVDEFFDTQLFSMFYLTQPKDLKMVLIDPKFINLIHYDGVPHLACPVVTKIPQIFETLEQLEDQIRWRHFRFGVAGVRSIEEYNVWSAQRMYGAALPYLLVVIHEVADLIRTDRKRTEDFIERITHEGRVGIHLILATRHPGEHTITNTMLRAVPARVALETEAAFIFNEKMPLHLPEFDEIEWLLDREINSRKQEMRYRANAHVPIQHLRFPQLSAYAGRYSNTFSNVLQTIREQNQSQYIDFFVEKQKNTLSGPEEPSPNA